MPRRRAPSSASWSPTAITPHPGVQRATRPPALLEVQGTRATARAPPPPPPAPPRVPGPASTSVDFCEVNSFRERQVPPRPSKHLHQVRCAAGGAAIGGHGVEEGTAGDVTVFSDLGKGRRAPLQPKIAPPTRGGRRPNQPPSSMTIADSISKTQERRQGILPRIRRAGGSATWQGPGGCLPAGASGH